MTRLYKNLTDSASCMGFYDVKNAKLCTIFQGEGLTHREPVLDEADFERFAETVEPLLQAKRDVLWVLCGRTESNVFNVKKTLRNRGFRWMFFPLLQHEADAAVRVLEASKGHCERQEL